MNLPAQLPPLRREAAFALPIRVLQFGQGNFLRGFVDWQLDVLNERCGMDLGVVIVRPTSRSTAPLLDTQGGHYTTVLRGLDGEGALRTEVRQVGCVQRELDLSIHFADYLALARNPDVRFVVSNTTEAGIAINNSDRYADQPPWSFPAKLTRWLYERYLHFGGDPARGIVLLPCELIEGNGPALCSAVLHYAALWQLAPGFETWLNQCCHFCSTLVDRIVTGYPVDEITQLQAELGYQDDFLVTGEMYHYWAIEAPPWVAQELPLDRAGLNVHWVTDLKPIRLRKVAILNGAHTVLAAVGLLMAVRTVGEAMQDSDLCAFLEATLNEEIIPALPFPAGESRAYAQDVLRRFRNPHIQHQLQAIALNMESKCIARLLPQVRSCVDATGRFPPRLLLALAAATEGLTGASAQLDSAVSGIAGLPDAVLASRHAIRSLGIRAALLEPTCCTPSA
jgi:tagaturonate reductase